MTSQGTKVAALATALALVAGAGFAALNTGTANMSKVVAIGDSWGMGVSNASIVTSHQQNSFPALFARQVGITDFQQPLVSEPGLGPEYALSSLVPSPVIGPKASTSGSPTNLGLTRAYDNMSISGANTCDVLNKKASTSPSDPTNLVLRGQGATQLQQALSLRPTFVLVMLGGNDALGAVLSGVAIEGVTLTPAATIQACYRQILGAIAASGAKMAVGVEPGIVTENPYANSVKPYVTLGGQKVYLIGQKTDGTVFQLTDQDYVTLPAGSLIPQGYGLSPSKPLPTSVVLDKAEIAAIEQRTSEIAAIIRSEANTVGAAIVEVGEFVHSMYVSPFKMGGMSISPSFLTGGFYGYDGFHPTDIGYGLIANLYIEAVNRKFEAEIPGVDMFPLLFGPEASPQALLGNSEVGATMFADDAEDQIRALLNVPSRQDVEAILAAQQAAPSGETTGDDPSASSGDSGPELVAEPILADPPPPPGDPDVLPGRRGWVDPD